MNKMKLKVTVSAPGKLELFGEHALVYGQPGIVTTVDQRLFVTIQTLEDKSLVYIKSSNPKVDLRVSIKDLSNKNIPKEAKFVSLAADNFFKKYYPNFKGGLKITTKSQFSSKLGFGSSSAVTTATIQALAKLFEKDLSLKQIFDLAYKTILDIQKKGSGVDVAASTYGGILYFVIGGKVIKPLKTTHLPLIIGYSGIKADTPTLLNQVAQKMKKYPKLIKNIFNSSGDLVNLASKSILNKDLETLGELMNINQGYLVSLGVSSQKLDNMINAAKNAGAYGAKLSGAGVGDCMIALAPPSKVKSVKKAVKKAGGKIIDVETNVEGVRIE